MFLFFRNILISIYVFSFSFSSFSQKIKYGKPKVDKEKKVIYIPFKIKESSKVQNLYDIKLFYTQGDSQKRIGPLKEVIGDVGENITPGEKVIVWNYWAEVYDDPDYVFDGQNVKFIVNMTYRVNPNSLMGPEAALYSLVLPGWGNTKTKPKPQHKRWYLTTATVFGLLGTGYLYSKKSSDTYEKYQKSNSIDEAQNNFKKASNQRLLSGTLITAGIAVWATDVTLVFIKGVKNKKAQNRLNKKMNNKPKPEISLINDFVQDQITYGIRIKF